MRGLDDPLGEQRWKLEDGRWKTIRPGARCGCERVTKSLKFFSDSAARFPEVSNRIPVA